MKILYGTGNQGKLSHMRRNLESLDIEIIGLDSMPGNIPEIDESGNDPLENARIKAAAYYEAFQMPVFSCDSGLYFSNLPAKVQPGVHVRMIGGKRLTDDEMVTYYSSLARQYGDYKAFYRNAICLIMGENAMYESMADELSSQYFMITSKPHSKREEGFPIDCISINIKENKYYYDMENNDVDNSCIRSGFTKFFKSVIK